VGCWGRGELKRERRVKVVLTWTMSGTGLSFVLLTSRTKIHEMKEEGQDS